MPILGGQARTPAWLADRSRWTRDFIRDRELRGWDPYDGLLSPVFRLPVLRANRIPRFLAQQAVLRSPVNLRPLLRVPPQQNAVTVGLYLQGVSDLAASGSADRAQAEAEASRWVRALAEMSASGFHGVCWGYPFPWEGRKHRMPTGYPTVVATGIVVNALHRVWQALEMEDARRLVVASADFVLRDLPRAAEDDGTWCWSYSPSDRQAVPNATMKATRLLAQAVDAGLDDTTALDAATASARFVAAHQSPDGGWPYAVGDDPRSWQDHHHTAYILECFDTYRRLTGDSDFDPVIERGWRHYRSAFFDELSLPRYYDNRDGPVDATAAGQALITLAAFDDIGFGLQVARASVDALGHADGSFAYRRHRRRTDHAHFMRWSTAWMFAGMARLLSARRRSAGPTPRR